MSNQTIWSNQFPSQKGQMSIPLRPSGAQIPRDQERKIPLEDFTALLLPSGPTAAISWEP